MPLHCACAPLSCHGGSVVTRGSFGTADGPRWTQWRTACERESARVPGENGRVGWRVFEAARRYTARHWNLQVHKGMLCNSYVTNTVQVLNSLILSLRCVLPKGAATEEVSLRVGKIFALPFICIYRKRDRKCPILNSTMIRSSAVFSPGEVPEVNVTLRRTSANKMFVHCESSGWFLKPHVSLLDAEMREIRVHTESWLGPDDLYSVRAQMDTAIGDSHPVKENTVYYVTGDVVGIQCLMYSTRKRNHNL